MNKNVEIKSSYTINSPLLKGNANIEMAKNIDTVKNLWSIRYSVLIKEFSSYKLDDKYFIHIVLKHYGKRKIDKLKLVLFADHGPINILYSSVPDLNVLKEKDVDRYNRDYRNGVFYSLSILIDNPKEEITCDWQNIPLEEDGTLSFSTLQIHEKTFIQEDFWADIGKLEKVNEDKIAELEMPKPAQKASRKKMLSGTSEQEQAIYYYVKQFFKDTENRAKLRNHDNDIIEADIYIPSIKVAIEYDGKYWHAKKPNQDSLKNYVLNSMGIYVIRVRDIGLPELEGFNGIVIYHGRNQNGKHMTEIITEIIHDLVRYAPDYLKEDMASFSLSYNEYLEHRLCFEAKLYIKPVENNFAKHPAIIYWDYIKNGDLNPNNLSIDSNAFAWFKCPNENSLIRILSSIYNIDDICKVDKMKKKNCIISICPFLPHDGFLPGGTDCGNECSYVETNFLKMIDDCIFDGLSTGKIDTVTYDEIKSYPRVAFKILKRIVDSSGDEQKQLEKMFFSEKNIYNGTVQFVSTRVKLDSVKDIEILKRFNKLYPNVLIVFNWDIFDYDFQTRTALLNYFSEMIMQCNINFGQFIKLSKCSMSFELQKMVNEYVIAHKKYI